MSLVDINYDDNSVMLARIIHAIDDGFMIQLFEETSTPNIFKFNREKTFIPQDSIIGYYDTDDPTQAGYSELGGDKYTTGDTDYEPSEFAESEDETLYEESDDEESDSDSDEED